MFLDVITQAEILGGWKTPPPPQFYISLYLLGLIKIEKVVFFYISDRKHVHISSSLESSTAPQKADFKDRIKENSLTFLHDI